MIDVDELNEEIAERIGRVWKLCEGGIARFMRGEATPADLGYAAYCIVRMEQGDCPEATEAEALALEHFGVAEALVAEFYYGI